MSEGKLRGQETRNSLALVLTVAILLSACQGATTQANGSEPSEAPTNESPGACSIAEPSWLTPPDDPAESSPPSDGFYFVNEDKSIWASAWWHEDQGGVLQFKEDGIKVAWYRPEGAPLEIDAQRLDGPAPPFKAEVPCCYPTRFQSTRLIFPTPGCWQISARADGKELEFVAQVTP